MYVSEYNNEYNAEVYDTALKWAEYGNTMMNSTDPVHLEGEEILTRVSRPYHFADLDRRRRWLLYARPQHESHLASFLSIG